MGISKIQEIGSRSVPILEFYLLLHHDAFIYSRFLYTSLPSIIKSLKASRARIAKFASNMDVVNRMATMWKRRRENLTRIKGIEVCQPGGKFGAAGLNGGCIKQLNDELVKHACIGAGEASGEKGTSTAPTGCIHHRLSRATSAGVFEDSPPDIRCGGFLCRSEREEDGLMDQSSVREKRPRITNHFAQGAA